MIKKFISILLFLFFVIGLKSQTIISPNHDHKLVFSTSKIGEPTFNLYYKNQEVIKPSNLGFEISSYFSGFSFSNNDFSSNFSSDFQVIDYLTQSYDESWRPVWGEEDTIRNHYNELLVELQQNNTGRYLNIRFRLFDTGLGFRYEIPKQNALGHFIIKKELTEKAKTLAIKRC